MADVLDEFPQDKQAQLKPAVDHWRMPYWDWANRDSASQSLIVPDLLKQPTVSVLRPNGLTATIDNPLSRYAFPMKDGKIDGIADVFRLGYNIPVRT
jgi:tyrosinase